MSLPELMGREGAPRRDTGEASVGRALLRIRHLGRMPYEAALGLQESLLAAKLAGDESNDLLLLDHPPVYTLGRGADEADLLGAPGRLGVPVFRVGRGGGATFHGPGQLIGYPIIHLRPSGRDVHRYVRALERVLIATCARFDVVAVAGGGQTGVWVGDQKIASIGIGVRRGITYHGVALNVTTDVAYFGHIVPCRGSGVAVTTLERLLGTAPAFGLVAVAFARCFADTLGFRTLDAEAGQ